MKQTALPPLPTLLDKLGKMTAIRDTHLVEQSLLRTLGPLLGVLAISLYRVDDLQVIVRALHYSRSIEGEHGGVERIVERVEEVLNNKELAEPIQFLIDNIRMLGRSCSRKSDDGLLVGYPLHGGKELCGYFVCLRDREVSPAEDAVVRGVLEVFSNYYALLDTSQRDRLTGLLNRYSLEINLDRLWNVLSARMNEAGGAENRRDSTPHTYWVGVIDIDHFKKVNDTYGHIMGDEVLLVVSRLLQSAFRRSDLLYRYGGEEFVAIIAANDLGDATLAFERARKVVAEYPFPQVGRVTISGGFSSADPAVLPQTVINRADRSLYQAKNDGRNRVYHHETLIQQGTLKEISDGGIDLF